MTISGRRRLAPPVLPASRRRGLRQVLAATATLALLATAACGGGSAGDQEPGAAPTTDSPVQLSVAWWGGPARAENTEKVLELYKKSHPNVSFTTQWQGYSGYYDKINTSAAGRNAPDIIQIDNRALREYANKGLIADLNPWAGKTLKVDQIDPKLLGTGKVDDKLYALPLASNTQALAVDTTVIEPLGLVPPETGWASWDEFGTWAAQVTTATGGKVWGTRDESANLSAFEYWLRQNGKELYDGQKPGFTAADATAWLDLWAKLRDSGAASPAEVAQPANAGDISKNTVATKQTVATFSYDNQLTELAKATDHKLMLVPLPGPAEGAYARPSQFFTAYAGGKNVATAVDVINFFVNDPEAGAILGTERGLPPNDQVSAAILPSFSEQLKYVAAYDDRVTSQAGDTPPVPAQGDSQIVQLLISAAENAGFGRQSTSDSAAEFFSQTTSALERASS
ncbi:ABC transporter substrate-binding protein [Pseudonocardia xinjiangensis]|uniref:Extracellular solute-binding protein n=1 Tax=Pseudonocardia xinjiangensis TaxID=75289 RepID=A0ABX1RB94_9PSEU|nr:extracellular solute-binding protein [Pseudonocardia xinjiangensis]NMH77667.1 extracellular solute-binding protein [Pseudonocardia xinjiangensis]